MAEEPIFRCARCGNDKPLEELPRATLAVCAAETAHPWSQLLCVLCVRDLIRMLHAEFCPKDVDGFLLCWEEHSGV